MSKEIQRPGDESERKELPIERGFPIERVNEIAEKEGRAGMHYRPIYTMHKWWARRLGCVFRTIALYSLVDDEDKVTIRHPGTGEEATLEELGLGEFDSLQDVIDNVSQADSEALWNLYTKDVTVEGKKILDPFMGGGTSVVEASRFGAEVLGNDLNPVAWFVTKKEIEAGQTDVAELEAGFEQVKGAVAEEIKSYYKTPCPHGDHDADAMYYFWTKELDCVGCGDTVSLFNDYRIGKARYDEKKHGDYNVLCPECESIVLVDGWQSECSCSECGHGFVPKDGTVSGGNYSCRSCGQKYGITDAIQEQDGFDMRLYAVEWFCPTCDDHKGMSRGEVKGYKPVEEADLKLFERAKSEWEGTSELREYVPDTPIRPGWKTASTNFDGQAPGAGDVFDHGYEKWTDMYNERQLLCLSTLLWAIDSIKEQIVKEYLLLAFSEALKFNSMLTSYQGGRNGVNNVFKTNSFDPPHRPNEGNIWGADYGMGSFIKTYPLVKSGVEYAHSPTERYMQNGETLESDYFDTPIGRNVGLSQGDAKELDIPDQYDVILTDPPYYNNVMYSELSDYFYVWQQLILGDQYEEFTTSHTPRAESIVSNPAENKDTEEFEDELRDSFKAAKSCLKEDGVITFTYHHSDSESWGELLESLCDLGLEITATYPISADIQKFTKGEAVSFDIIVVARPTDDRTPISWNALRREIYRTARHTRTQLEENRDLSRGDIGVMEMGECFREYSKHHGKVQRDGEIMTAKEVVDEIYGIIQPSSEIGTTDVFIDLLDTDDPTYDDVNKLCRGTNAKPETLKEMCLYNQDDGFALGTWDDQKRQAYIQERINGDGDDHLTDLDKIQFLRYRYERGEAVQNYVNKWGVDDDLRELAGHMADVTGDDTYTRVLGDRDITSYS